MAAIISKPSVSNVLRLSIRSAKGTLGWKKIGASKIDKTDSTVSNFSMDCSSDLIVPKDSSENKSEFGVKVTIRKSEFPNTSPVSL